MASTKLKIPPAASPRPSAEAFRELIRLLGLLERVMQPYFAQFGISGAQWGVLRNLRRAEEKNLPGLRLTDLSERLLIRPPSVTGVVDRLERAGLVVRDGTPTDLRAKQVTMTDKGRALVEKVQAVHEDQIDTIMGSLTAAEQADLRQLLDKLARHLETLVLRNGEEVG